MATLRRPRICFVTVEFHGLFRNGGIGTANTALALALAAHGFDVTVAVADADESGPRLKMGDFAALKTHYATRGITLDYVRPHPAIQGSFDEGRSTSYCVFLYVQAGDFDVVMFNDNCGQGYYTLQAKHTGVFVNAPVLCVVAHGPVDWVHELNSQEYHGRNVVAMTYMERRCAVLADHLISPSRYLLDWMQKRDWIAQDRGRVLQNLIGNDRGDGLRESPGNRAVNELVFFGRQETRKGVAIFCDAMDLLSRSIGLDDVKVTFLGKFSRIGAVHTGVYLAERARRWRAMPRIITAYDQAEALDYLLRPGVLAVVPSLAENSPCVVAECLQHGVLFLATDTGGTPELVACEDRERCLFPPHPEALARRLEQVLREGHRRAKLAVAQRDTLTHWLDFIDQALARRSHLGPVPRTAIGDSLVSVCFAWSGTVESRNSLAAVLRQKHPRLEIVVAATAADSSSLAAIDDARITICRDTAAGPGAARNAAASLASGDYLLFVDEASALLHADAVSRMLHAAACTAADVITGFRALDERDKLGRPSTREWELPMGACLELGVHENCFGRGVLLMKSSLFDGGLRFDEEAVGEALEWSMAVAAVLRGAVLEVVPAELLQIRESSEWTDAEKTVGNHRRILRLYRQLPMETVNRLLETALGIGKRNQQHMHRALSGVGKAAHDLAARLASLDPNTTEAMRLFVLYCCERRMLDLALDFALHNDASFLPETVTAMAKVNTRAARDLTLMRHLELRHPIDLTPEFSSRARPFQGLLERDITRPAGGGVVQAALAGDSILKVACIGPPGSVAVRVAAKTSAPGPLRLAAAVCRSNTYPVLSADGVLPGDGIWWSGWVAAEDPAAHATLDVGLPVASGELLDLYLISRLAASAAPQPVAITWTQLIAESCMNGDFAPSSIERETVTSEMPADFLTRGTLLTDVSDVPFRVFLPGTRTLLHPVIKRVPLVRVPGAVPAGSLGLQCFVSVENAKAHPVEFGLWIRPSANPASSIAELSETANFSGWIMVDKPLEKQKLTLLMAERASQSMDLYLATRVRNFPDAYYCHAYWHEFSIIQDHRYAVPAAAQASAAKPAASGPTRRCANSMPHAAMAAASDARISYLLCTSGGTGGNLLASTLRRMQLGGLCVAGRPLEYFSASAMDTDFMLGELAITGRSDAPPDLAERLDAVLRAGTTPNGVFGALLYWRDLDPLMAALGQRQGRLLRQEGHAPDGLRSFFPRLRYIWMRRDNIVAQAIADYLASCDVATQPGMSFDFAAIRQRVAAAESEDSGWRKFLAGSADITLALTHEEAAADLAGVSTRIMAFLDLGIPREGIPLTAFRRRSDARALEWEHRYRELDRALHAAAVQA